jgi:hypothetical protein
MQLYIPGALGMILSGVLLRNVGGGIVIAGLKASWSKQIRGAALAIIFLRSGLEIDLDVRYLSLFLRLLGICRGRCACCQPSVLLVSFMSTCSGKEGDDVACRAPRMHAAS